HGAGLAGIEDAIVVGVQEHRNALQARFATLFDTISLEIVERLAADAIRGEETEVAEVHYTDRGATADRDFDWLGAGAHKVGCHHLPVALGARGPARVPDATLFRSHGAGLTDIERAIVVGVQEDRNALQAGFSAILDAITVEVIEHLATDAI